VNKREAKHAACGIAAMLIENYFEVGQPFNEFEDEGKPEADAQRLYDALRDLRDELFRRAPRDAAKGEG